MLHIYLAAFKFLYRNLNLPLLLHIYPHLSEMLAQCWFLSIPLLESCNASKQALSCVTITMINTRSKTKELLVLELNSVALSPRANYTDWATSLNLIQPWGYVIFMNSQSFCPFVATHEHICLSMEIKHHVICQV
jgi:hypothetical protein